MRTFRKSAKTTRRKAKNKIKQRFASYERKKRSGKAKKG